MKVTVNAIAAEMEEVDVHKVADRDPQTEEHYPCRVPRKVTITAYLQAAVLVSCDCAVLMTIETHGKVF